MPQKYVQGRKHYWHSICMHACMYVDRGEELLVSQEGDVCMHACMYACMAHVDIEKVHGKSMILTM